MVQTTDLRNTDDVSLFGRLYRSWFGCVLVQRQVTAAVMVVVEKRSEMARQVSLVKNDHVVQALAANGPDHPFHIGALPGRARGRQHLFDTHGLHLFNEVTAEDPVAIAQGDSVVPCPRGRLRAVGARSMRRSDARSRQNAE